MFSGAPRRVQALCLDASHQTHLSFCRSRYVQRSWNTGARYNSNQSHGKEPQSQAESELPQTPPTSIFSGQQSPWEQVFKNIKKTEPILPTTLRNPLSPKTPRGPRRQTMTAREIQAFDEMFNMIFDAVAEQKQHGTFSGRDSGIGIGDRDGLGDFFGKLRRHSKRLKWTTEEDELLDKKKEQMDLCDTDQQLLEWAMTEVFGEFKAYEKESRKAIETIEGMEQKSEKEDGGSAGTIPEFPTPPRTYPHIIPLLMRTFRDKYRDPHLALAIFDHARHLSIPSYVFGCSTAAYNELLETKWRNFRDLKGFHDSLEEMWVNGVDVDNATRKLTEVVRREVGDRSVWAEEDNPGSGDVWDMLNRIEKLVTPPKNKSPNKVKGDSYEEQPPAKWDEWKSRQNKDDDDWEFDSWEKPKPSRRR